MKSVVMMMNVLVSCMGVGALSACQSNGPVAAKSAVANPIIVTTVCVTGAMVYNILLRAII